VPKIDETDQSVLVKKTGLIRKQAFKDSLILGPIDKYLKYNIFPWKFLIHICLLFLTAWQVLLQIVPQTAY